MKASLRFYVLTKEGFFSFEDILTNPNKVQFRQVLLELLSHELVTVGNKVIKIVATAKKYLDGEANQTGKDETWTPNDNHKKLLRQARDDLNKGIHTIETERFEDGGSKSALVYLLALHGLRPKSKKDEFSDDLNALPRNGQFAVNRSFKELESHQEITDYTDRFDAKAKEDRGTKGNNENEPPSKRTKIAESQLRDIAQPLSTSQDPQLLEDLVPSHNLFELSVEELCNMLVELTVADPQCCLLRPGCGSESPIFTSGRVRQTRGGAPFLGMDFTFAKGTPVHLAQWGKWADLDITFEGPQGFSMPAEILGAYMKATLGSERKLHFQGIGGATKPAIFIQSIIGASIIDIQVLFHGWVFTYIVRNITDIRFGKRRGVEGLS